jgi:AraC-like DNA-binding protein
MNLDETWILLLATLGLGISLLSANLLLLRTFQQNPPGIQLFALYFPLALFFIANGITEFASVFMSISEYFDNDFWIRLFAVMTLPFHLALAPLFWLYVRALTSEQPNLKLISEKKHFIPVVLACLIPILSLWGGKDTFLGLFDAASRNASTSLWLAALLIQVLEVLIILQAAFYIGLSIIRLKQYRVSLSKVFASTEKLELTWLRLLFAFLIIYALLSIISYLMPSPIFFEPWESLVDLLIIWFVAVWSLRQKPGLAVQMQEIESVSESIMERYSKSGLNEQRVQDIADKVHRLMQEEQLFLDPDFSLAALSKQVNELPNYVSQALSQCIRKSFYDFINGLRVEYAKKRLMESKKSVLTISLDSGFNSRSSFYKAFKKETGSTPSEYKNANKSARV